jgi:hypothetical protein
MGAARLSFALGLLFWAARVLATDANDELEFHDAPKAAKQGDCIGYPVDPTKMPPGVKRAVDAANQKYREQANEADDAFLRATGLAGKQWEQETSASVARMTASIGHLEYPEIPTQPNGALPSEEEMRKFRIRSAEYKLASLKVLNRQKEEDAEAELRFAQRGGNMAALYVLQLKVNELLETCRRAGDRIYQTWWDAEKENEHSIALRALLRKRPLWPATA